MNLMSVKGRSSLIINLMSFEGHFNRWNASKVIQIRFGHAFIMQVILEEIFQRLDVANSTSCFLTLQEKSFRFQLSGDEVYYTNVLLLPIKIVLCGNLHCHQVLS